MNPFRSFRSNEEQSSNGEGPYPNTPTTTDSLPEMTASYSSINTRIRAIVVLPNGSKIAIPIPASATILNLQAEALRRAKALRLPYAEDNTVLHLGARNGPIAFGEDLIEDVLDLATDNTFWLISLEETLQSASLNPELCQPRRGDYPVYVRWVTPARAIGSTRLSEISPDFNSFPSKTTISELRAVAFDRLYRGLFPGEEKPLPNTTAELFLTTCHLSTSNANSLSLADLQLDGTLENPLDLFVVLRKKEAATTTTPHTLWAFARSDRGSATFFTSLKVLLREINTIGGLQEMLKVLWDITHFPPALIAFQQLHDEGKLLPLPCAVLAACFRELALEMVPPWIADSREEVLESSRQVFAWVYSLYLEASKKPAGSEQALVHTATLSEVVSEIPGTSTTPGLDGAYIDIVSFMASGGPTAQSEPSNERKLHRVSVSRERRDRISPHLIAMAQWGTYDLANDYYVDWPSGSELYYRQARFPLLDPSDFNNLLVSANASDIFKLVGPLQLGKAIVPVITLNKQGYVSVYDLESTSCGEYYPTTWNIISGRETLSSTDPGQFLAQKLQTIIAQRKKMHCWEVDAWAEEGGIIGVVSSPDEAIVICVDRSSSMQSPMDSDWMPRPGYSRSNNDNLSRLSEVKEVFQNLVARTAAYKISTHLGLVVFSGKAEVTMNQDLTPVLYDFKDRLMDITPTGVTAIWDALVKAKQMLVKFAERNPSTKLRIIVLTDGEDNDSICSVDFACRELYNANIVLDSVVIGTSSTENLFKISKHTGGYAFRPKTRSALFQIFLLETFIDIKMRPDIERVPIQDFSTQSTPKNPDMENTFDFPQCRQHQNQNDTFIDLRETARFFLPSSRSSAISGHSGYSNLSQTTITARTPSISSWDAITLNSRSNNSISSGASGAHRIILREVRQMAANQHPYMDVYISESNMGFWKVAMQGPPASPYSNGTFLLYIEMGDSFPRQAPSARFITPVLHPNITKHGRICHAIFDRDWNPEMHIYEVLQSVYGILMTLEVRDAVDPMSTLKFWTDPESSQREIAQYIQHFARQDRTWHRRRILDS